VLDELAGEVLARPPQQPFSPTRDWGPVERLSWPLSCRPDYTGLSSVTDRGRSHLMGSLLNRKPLSLDRHGRNVRQAWIDWACRLYQDFSAGVRAGLDKFTKSIPRRRPLPPLSAVRSRDFQLVPELADGRAGRRGGR